MAENGGALSSAGRFDRMEATLLRIEDKLASKVDVDQLAPFERRIGALEGGNTPMGQLLLEEFRQMKIAVSDLTNKGSRNAQEAQQLVHDLQKDVLELERDQIRRQTVTRVIAIAGGSLAVIVGVVNGISSYIA